MATIVNVGRVRSDGVAAATTHRRLCAVERNPGMATIDDVVALLRSHGVREQMVAAVRTRIREADLDPVRVWRWTMAFDGAELAVMCYSPLSHAVVREHIMWGTLETDLDALLNIG